MDTLLPPVDQPTGLFWKMSYAFMRRKFGKVMTPARVFSVRMPRAFTMFYAKIGKLDKRVELPDSTVALVRERVAMVNGCGFCMDANKAAAVERSAAVAGKLDALEDGADSELFSPAERAALEYATEVTRDRTVSDATFAELQRHYGEREICDIVWLVASEHLFNLTNIALNIGSDGLCEVLAARAARA